MPGPSGPMELLREEISSEQTAVKINAIHRIGIIATLIGSSKVKRELLPYVESLINDQEDEVLFAIAQVLGTLFPDYTNNYEIIIPILETLAAFEETVVRQEAVNSIINISSKLSSEHNAGVIVPSVLRLANGDWFTSRVSAIHIMASLYDKSGIHKDTLRKKFIDLSREQTPMIKRAVAAKIGVLSDKMSTEFFMIELMPIFKGLASDDQDGVRILIVESLIIVSRNLSKDMNKTHMIPILIQLTRDRAWSVRKNLAKNFTNIAKALGSEITDNSLVNIFSTLILDPEGDVRTAAVANFIEFVKCISPNKLNSITQQMLNLVKDTLPLVRSRAAEVLINIIPKLKKEIIKEKVMPVLLDVIKNEQNHEVKVEVIECFKHCGLAIGQDFFSIVSQIDIGKIMNETPWRVRRAALQMITDLAEGFKAVELFEVHLQEFFFRYIDDNIHAIREFGNSQLHKILKIESANWVMGTLIPKIEQNLAKDTIYLKKITALYGLEVVCQSFTGSARSKALSIILGHTKDKVPNVRMVAIKICHDIYSELDNSEQASVRSAVSALIADTDKDVRDVSKDFTQEYGS